MSWTDAERRGCEEKHKRIDLEIRDMKRDTARVETCSGRKLSRWTAALLIIVLLSIVGACYAIAGGALSRTAEQGERTRAVEVQAESNTVRLDRIEKKIDEILAPVK